MCWVSLLFSFNRNNKAKQRLPELNWGCKQGDSSENNRVFVKILVHLDRQLRRTLFAQSGSVAVDTGSFQHIEMTSTAGLYRSWWVYFVILEILIYPGKSTDLTLFLQTFDNSFVVSTNDDGWRQPSFWLSSKSYSSYFFCWLFFSFVFHCHLMKTNTVVNFVGKEICVTDNNCTIFVNDAI